MSSIWNVRVSFKEITIFEIRYNFCRKESGWKVALINLAAFLFWPISYPSFICYKMFASGDSVEKDKEKLVDCGLIIAFQTLCQAFPQVILETWCSNWSKLHFWLSILFQTLLQWGLLLTGMVEVKMYSIIGTGVSTITLARGIQLFGKKIFDSCCPGGNLE